MTAKHNVMEKVKRSRKNSWKVMEFEAKESEPCLWLGSFFLFVLQANWSISVLTVCSRRLCLKLLLRQSTVVEIHVF